MAESTYGPARETGSSLFTGVAVIVLAGAALGLAQNWLLNRGAPAKGLPWIAEEKTLDSLENLAGSLEASGASASGGVVDSPFAVAPGGAAADRIPDLGRPLQMQLPAVKSLYDEGAALILDVRDPEEYRAGHIAGALLLPYDEAVTDPERLERLDAGGKPIVVYCGGGTCELSMNMAYALVEAGQRRVLVFMGGYPEWAAAGYPTATGEGEVAR